MSAKAEKKAEAAAPEAAPKKKKGMLFIIIGLVVVLAGGGAGAFVMMNKADKKAQAAKGAKHADAEHDGEAEGEEGETEEDDAHGKGKKPVFYSLEPFVVNLAGDSQHYLQVGLDLKLSKEEYTEKVKTVLPEIRNDVVLLLSSKQATEVVSMEDKNYLRTQIRAAANKAIGVKDRVKRRNPEQEVASANDQEEHAERPEHDEAPRKGVVDVLLTSFVIQ